MKIKEGNSILFRGNKQTLYFMTLIALLAMGVGVYLTVPSLNSAGTVSAQAQETISEAHQTERATPEMLAYALNFKDNLGDSLNAINQLPCTELSGAELGGKTLEPGVYCLESARLSGELVLDGQNDASSIFIFIARGSINVEDGSTISLRNHAQAGGVFFVANDSATVGANSEFRGRILANNNILVENGARVTGGKLMSVKGEVSRSNATDGGGTGTLQICKAQVLPAGGTSLANRIFNFTVSSLPGVVIPVPVGGCSGQIDVPAGMATVTELNTGQLINPSTGTFTGNFQLVGVNQLSTNPQPGSSSLGVVNLAARTAAINIVEGGVTQQLTLQFVNQFAITGFVEICKRAAALPTGQGFIFTSDPDVTGFFNFNVEGVFTTNPATGVRTLTNFVAPVGGCTGPIAVTILNPPPTGSPASSTVRISELGRAGVFLESVDTVPADRETAPEVLGSRVNENSAVVANPGGGFATVRVFEAATSINETLVNFRNRTSSRVKVCKIAGPGIPANTPFTFTVTGFGFGATAGTIVPITRTVTVLAGPAGVGGFCQFVPDLAGTGFQNFVTGTDVTVNETGPVTIGGDQVRTSRIRVTPGGTATQPVINLVPTAARISTVFAAVRSEVTEFEFTNFIFRPTTLKVCKIAAGTIAQGTPFTFDIAFVSPTGQGGALFPAQTATVTVLAGPASQNGFCTDVNPALGTTPFIGGAFNQGSTITITERTTTPATFVTAITAPTAGVGGLVASLATRTATLTGPNGLVGATINTVIFTNSNTPGPTPPASDAAFDFDGDGKSDLSVFRPANGTWYVNQSQNGFAGLQFGSNNDRIVPADYDGDGKTDFAVYRDGIWYMQRSTSGFSGVQFGEATDIPMPGDYDGDGKADIAVFRPSTGIWYIQRSQLGFIGIAFGQTGDRPVAADYDNDGKADVAVYRNGIWYIQNSQAGFTAVSFGIADDRPIPADYDGDGKSDVAVFRPATGVWYIMGSTAGLSGVSFGISSDTPSPADYDGDGKADIAVFRQSDGMWYANLSTAGSMTRQFGANNDKSVPNAFVR